MAIDPTENISVIYEVSKPSYQFYAIEKSGFTNTGHLARDIATEMTKDGKFSHEAGRLIDENNFELFTPEFPPKERLIRVENKGVGYKINNILQIPLENNNYVQVQVANVDPKTHGISQLKVLWPGSYEVPAANSAPAEFSTNLIANTAPISDSLQETVSWIIQGNTNNTTGTVPASPSITTSMSSTVANEWTTEYGRYGGGGTKGSRWPSDGIWFQANIVNRYPGGTKVGSVDASWIDANSGKEPLGDPSKTSPTGNNPPAVWVGQIVELDPSWTNNPNSSIPPGTKVTEINSMKYIYNFAPTNAKGTQFGEVTTNGTYIKVSNPVKIAKGDKLRFRGGGATISNSLLQWPKAWRMTFEAKAGVDPLNDPLGIQGEIVNSRTNTDYIEIQNLAGDGSTPWLPQIYDGMAVQSTIPNGSIGPGDIVYVSSVTTNGSIANVKLSRTLSSVTAGETLRFIFDQLQPWRLCFDIVENMNVEAHAKEALKSTPGALSAPNATAINDETLRKKVQEIGPQGMLIYAATELQLPNSGLVTPIRVANVAITSNAAALSTTNLTYDVVDVAGIMGRAFTGKPATSTTVTRFGANLSTTGTIYEIDLNKTNEGFINRANRVGATPSAYPFNYSLLMTNRGMFLGVWEGTWSTLQKRKITGRGGDSYFNWLLIQRPVDRYTGRVYTKGRAPVFCVNSVGYEYWKFIVREEDVLHPSHGDPDNVKQRWNFANSTIINDSVPYRVPADTNTQDSFAIINSTNQVSLTEDSKYLVSFLHNLSTPRFRYSEELDMLGQTSADVCMASTDISITAYNESGARTYHALPANNPYNTGLRMVVLKDIPQVE